MEKLGQDDEESLVRKRVAANPNTPVDVLQQLAEDEDSVVRGSVAIKRDAPLPLLKMLVKDKDKTVKKRARKTLLILEYQAAE